jgi:glutathione S-transferase
MKLYNLDHSPYATRVRTVIRKKGLDIPIEAPPVALRTTEFVERFPVGKLPVLELDDGHMVADSWVIMEYLENVFPQPALAPTEPLARAQMSLLARCADTCLGPGGLFPLFALVSQPDGRDNAGEVLENLDKELARLNRTLQSLPEFQRREVHLGDIALVPHVDYVKLLTPMFGRPDMLAQYETLVAWDTWVKQDEFVAASSQEMLEAVAAFFG